jgi:hypothetical protein
MHPTAWAACVATLQIVMLQLACGNNAIFFRLLHAMQCRLLQCCFACSQVCHTQSLGCYNIWWGVCIALLLCTLQLHADGVSCLAGPFQNFDKLPPWQSARHAGQHGAIAMRRQCNSPNCSEQASWLMLRAAAVFKPRAATQCIADSYCKWFIVQNLFVDLVE